MISIAILGHGVVGSGVADDCLAFLSLGTSGVISAHAAKLRVDGAGRVHTFCGAVPGEWLVVASEQSAGLSMQWMRNTLYPEDNEYARINADIAAGAIAGALRAHKVIFLTDVDGLYEDFSDKSSLISNLTMEECQTMLDRGEIDTGMIPKLNACIEAVKAGVFRAHIINGTTPHSLLLELLTDAGVGTVLHSSETAYEYDTHPHPLSTFAARLFENLDEVSKLQALS